MGITCSKLPKFTGPFILIQGPKFPGLLSRSPRLPCLEVGHEALSYKGEHTRIIEAYKGEALRMGKEAQSLVY